MLIFPALVINPWSLSVWLLLYYVATKAFGIMPPYLPTECAEVISKLSLLASGLKFLIFGDAIMFLSCYLA